MAELIKVNKKVINDPLYTPVIKFLKDRIATLEVTGPEDELALSKQRYDGLVAGDLVIESAITFPDGAVRVCIISRKTGFARVDIDIKYVQMDDILTDFAVPLVEIEDIDHLKTYVKGLVEPVQPTLFYLKYKDTYGVLVTQEQAKTHEGPMEAFGNLFFENYVTERESENSIDWETLECGTVTITDPSFGRGVYPLFIYELVLSEAQLPEITSNLPASITSRRGENFTIPNTFWFAGTQDITTVATVELSTKSGYAILERSSDLLEIDGETIYGSSTEEVQDQIVVRVTYDWNGRLVRKNFYIDLKIEKDAETDLVITSVPSDVTATSGDTIQVTMTAKYKGDVVEILIPPAVLKSKAGRSDLRYVKTNRDLSMVYQGTVNYNFSGAVEKVGDLAAGEFSYNDNGTIVKSIGFVNVTIVKPDEIPAFTVTGVASLLQGYVGDTGSYIPTVKYGDQVIPLTECNIATGVQGSKSLVEITEVSDSSGISWKLIKDSQNPGQPIRDTFTQTYQWLDPRGVLQTKQFVIQVDVKLNSIIKVIPGSPLNVRRYQMGGPTWTLEVNGVASNNLIDTFSLDTPVSVGDDEYIINRPNIPNQWFVINADPDKELDLTGKFTFTAEVDDVVQTFHVDQEFIIDILQVGTPDGKNPNPPPVTPIDPNNPNEQGTGPGGQTGPEDPTAPGGTQNPDSPGTGDGPYNAELSAVPQSFTIAGNSDRNYTLSFKIYKDSEDVTSQSEIMADYTVTPDYVTFKSMVYDATTDMFVVTYTKNKGGKSEGAIFAKMKDNSDPTKRQIARLWINVDVQQIKILKAIDAPSSITLDVEVSKDLPLEVEFSGTRLALNDSNLKITKQGAATTNITNISADALTFLNNAWSYIGTTFSENAPLQFEYTDPADGKVYNLQLPFTVRTVYPPMEVVYTGERVIDTAIWEKGTFPLKLMAGEKDWTSALTQVEVVSGNKYITVNRLNWEIINAEKTAISQIVGLNLNYIVGNSGPKTLPADFKFNLAAWDGITFAVTSLTPESIEGDSGDKADIAVKFVFKGQDRTSDVTLDLSKSTVPDTVKLGTPAFDADRGLVIPYELTLGGDYPMKLVFNAPSGSTATTTVNMNTSVTWPNDLNVVSKGDNIRGYWNDNYDYPLVLNYYGTPVPLTDPNLDLTFASGDGNPIELVEAQEENLKLLLAAGGELGKSYDYTVVISLTYTNQTTGVQYSKEITVPATIRVPAVKVGQNPQIQGDVWERGPIPITLVDERGKSVPITVYKLGMGGGVNVTLTDDNEWYITNGSTIGQGEGELPLILGYDYGGVSHEIEVTEKFTINKWDGNFFSATSEQSELEGDAGTPGDIDITALWVGYPAEGVTIDRTRSTIPGNISLGELTPVYSDSGKFESYLLPYTLASQADTDLKICLVKDQPQPTQVEGLDFVYLILKVSTKSSNEPFTLVSSDDAITLDWGKTAVLKVKMKYGDYDLPANTPGLKYSLADADVHGIMITGATKDGIIVKGTRSDVAGSTKVYPESINISYDVGAPEPKTASFDLNATVSMGPVTVINNDKVNVSIWDLGSFRQGVQFNGVTLNTIDHFELRGAVENKYIELTQPRSYEIIGAETTTTTQSIPMTAYYKVDATDTLQEVDFDAQFQIAGSTSVRFKVTVSPAKLEGSLNNESVLTCTPVYKDKLVGGNATFKPDLSTIPPELTLKDYKVVNNDYVITFVGAKGGLDTMELVFWSPDAGTDPKPRDVAKVTIDVKVMGELGLEIGTRDNLITGKNADTGTYKFQILFGGIPIDAAAEIAAGNLTAVREVGNSTSSNANVIVIDKWNAESYEFTLTGCVQPNATVNVSDYINLTYKYGGQNFTRRVEIPLKYTSSVPTFGNWPTAALQVFDKGILAPTATCDGVSIAPGISSISNYGDEDDTYIALGASKSYEVIWGEKSQITHNVSARIIGQYRVWTWSVILDIPFTIAAWNQKTWDPAINITNWNVYPDLTGDVRRRVDLTAKYRKTVYNKFTTATGSILVNDKSDLLGLIKLPFFQYASNQTQQYTLLNIPGNFGTGTAKLCFRRPDGDTPGIENIDYTYIDLPVTITENSLVGNASTGITGGNGDTVTGPLVVRLKSDNSQISNINANLKIATVDETVMKITSMAGSTITVQITAPFTQADGPVSVPMTFTYTDPNTGYVTEGTFNYPVVLKRPADWPVVTAKTSGSLLKLYDYGPNPFKITVSGVDVSSQVVPTSCVDDAAGQETPSTSNYMQLSLDQPVAGTWWWITGRTNNGGQQGRTTKWKMDVPYRGTTVSVDGSFYYIRAVDGANPPAEFQGSTTLTKILMQDVGEQAEIPFNLLWRNYKYNAGVFKPDVSAGNGAKFSDYFKVVGQRYDDSTGTTYLKIELLQPYEGPMNFVWDMVENLTDPVVGTNRASISTSFYDLTITDLKNNAWVMWNRRQLSTLISIKDGDTELANTSQVIAIDNTILVPDSTGANTYVFAKSDVATSAFTGDIVYTVQLPASYGNRQIKVKLASTIAAYDGNEFTLALLTNDTTPVAVGTGFRYPYFTPKFRNASVAASGLSSSTADLVKSSGIDSLSFYRFYVASPSNMISYMFQSSAQVNGTVRIGIHYIGTGSTDYPKGTLGKNYAELEVPGVVFYEKKIYFFPDNTPPDQIQGSKGNTVLAPCQFSMGLNLDMNIIYANDGNITYSLGSGNAGSGVVALATTKVKDGIRFIVNYDNRGDDMVVDVPVHIAYNGTYREGGVGSTLDYVQKVLIKGTQQGDTITTTPTAYTNSRVWDVSGPAVTIVQNGVTITAAQITDIQIAPNPYIRRPETNPNFTNRWFEIYNGKTDGPTQTTATFTITYNDGARSRTVTVDVPITIQQYSGSPWDIKTAWINAPANYYALGPNAVVNGNSTLYLRILYKGQALTQATAATYLMSTVDIPTAVPGFASILSQGYFLESGTTYYLSSGEAYSGVVYRVIFRAGADDTLTKKAAKIKFGFADKVDDSGSVPGQDWTYIYMDSLTWAADYQYYLVSQDVTEYTGKFGDPNVKFPFTIRRLNALASLTAYSAWAFGNAGNLQPVYGLNDQNSVVTAKFGAELTTMPKQTLDTIIYLGAGSPPRAAQATIRVTQISNYKFPTVSGVNKVTASLNQSGGIPFKIADDSGNDITSQATITAISTNDYVNLNNGKWVCYNTRTADTEIQITFTFQITYQGNLLTMTQDVPFLIQPFSGQPTVSDVKVISGKVWDAGSTLPFTINMNGNPVPASWITAVTGTAANGRVSAPSVAVPWKIIGGDVTKAVSDTFSYVVTVTTGGNSWTVRQDVVFNIAQYDGIEFKLNLANLQAGNKELQAIFLTYNASGTNGIYFEGRYRGDLVPSPIGVSLSGAYLRIGNGPINGASYVAWAVQPSGAPARATATWTARIKRASSAGNIENSDVTSLPVPTYFVVGAGDMFVHTGTTKAISGKKGDQPALVLNMFRYSGTPTTTTLTDLTVGSTTVEFSPANVIELVPGSITKNGYKVRYINTLYTDTQTNVTATVKTSTGNVTYVIDVTQLASPADQPDVVDNNGQTAGINQTGTLPFKLVDPDTQQDVTSTATIASIDSNDYIELVDGKWRVKKDVTADTHSNVTFNLTLNYRSKDISMAVVVDFLIKPFDGNFVITAVPDIAANVWDRGTVIPLTISVNGNAMPASWITGYAANPADQYVTVAADGSWQVVAGNKDAAMTETVGYAANVSFPGGTTAQAIAPVKYNISKYDGVEFKLSITNLNTDGVLLIQFGSAARASIQGWYRGDIIGGSSGYTLKEVVTNVNITGDVNAINLSGTAKIYDFPTNKGAAQAQNVVSFYRPGITSGGVKDIDYCELVVPITSWVPNSVLAGQKPSVFEGKLGDELTLVGNVYVGGTKVSLTNTGLTITPDESLNIEVVSGSVTDNGFKVRFKSDVAQDTTVKSVIVYHYKDNTYDGTSSPEFTVVQHSADTRPVVDATGTMQPVEYGETGQIVLTGTYGDQALAGNVTFVPESSDTKGLVEFGTPTTGDNGTVVIPVTGIKVGKDNLTIHIKVNGATGNTSGKDYLDITVAAEVTYASLGESEDFQTSGTGYQNTPVTLTQSVILPTDE